MPQSDKGIVFDIKRYAIHDGPGIRVTVFLKGCPLRCWWCHNPECREMEVEDPAPSGESRLVREARTRPIHIDGFYFSNFEKRAAGREMTVGQVMAEIEKELPFMEESGGGVTFSGGEPLLQPEFLTALLEECRREEIHTILDTSGLAPADVFGPVARLADFVHYDLKLVDDADHRKYTGISNRLILENLKALAGNGNGAAAAVAIRFPVVPGVTDTPKNLDALAALLGELGAVGELHLLPYHRTADAKYQRLGLESRMKGVKPPTKKNLDAIKKRFENQGLRVKIGG